jgi:hypothetical protein
MSQTLLRKAFGVSWHYQHVRTDFQWGGVRFFLAPVYELFQACIGVS